MPRCGALRSADNHVLHTVMPRCDRIRSPENHVLHTLCRDAAGFDPPANHVLHTLCRDAAGLDPRKTMCYIRDAAMRQGSFPGKPCATCVMRQGSVNRKQLDFEASVEYSRKPKSLHPNLMILHGANPAASRHHVCSTWLPADRRAPHRGKTYVAIWGLPQYLHGGSRRYEHRSVSCGFLHNVPHFLHRLAPGPISGAIY